jgi:hypothetical protein
MSKRNKSKHQQRQKAHIVHFPGVGLVQLAPGRESKTPFCSYYGSHGETCSITTGLAIVWRMPSKPPVEYFACPLHYDAVYQMVQTFLSKLEKRSKHVWYDPTNR